MLFTTIFSFTRFEFLPPLYLFTMNAASVARKRRRDFENAKVEADERVLLQHEVENVDAVHAPFEFNAIDENPLPHDGEAVGGGG